MRALTLIIKISFLVLFSVVGMSFLWDDGISVNTADAEILPWGVGNGHCAVDCGEPVAPPFISKPGDWGSNKQWCTESHMLPTDSRTYRVVLRKLASDDEGKIYVNGNYIYVKDDVGATSTESCPCCSTCDNNDCRMTGTRDEELRCVINENNKWLDPPIDVTPYITLGGSTTITFDVKDECGDCRGIWALFDIYKYDYIDIGLRVFDGNQNWAIAAEWSTDVSPLRIAKNTTVYRIALVDPIDPQATRVRIKTDSGVKALRKCLPPPYEPSCKKL